MSWKECNRKECNRMDERLRFVARLLDGENGNFWNFGAGISGRNFGTATK
jgi:hypothetical protein